MHISRNQVFLLLATSALCQCQGAADSTTVLHVLTQDDVDPGPAPQPPIRDGTMYIRDDFPALATGVKAFRRLGFQNFGSKEVTILGVERVSGDREFSVQLPLPLVLPVGGAPELQLTEFFEPSPELGEKSAQIVWRTDAEDLPFIELDLKGVAVAR